MFVGVLVVLAAGPLLLGKYLDKITSNAQYFNRDASVRFRTIEFQYFYDAFQHTYGLGFGVMSTGVGKKNILSYAANQAGYIYGTGSYGLGLSDIGIFSALTQFGYIGLIITLFMTGMASFKLIKYARADPRFWSAGAAGCLMLAFMLSPLPMNFFTLQWTVFVGNVLWFLAAQTNAEFDRAAAIANPMKNPRGKKSFRPIAIAPGKQTWR
jgi:hypothetical protein